MDLTILIFITLFVVACFSLFLVYKFGIKEKSYEEALAEQRQQNSTLLGTKSKPKEKKNKKQNKKPKEKQEKFEVDEVENNENKENTQPAKPHVEFKEEAEELPIKEEVIPIVKEQKREDIFKQETAKEKVVKEKKQTLESIKNKKNVKPQTDAAKTQPNVPLPLPEERKPEEKPVLEVIPVVPQTNGVVVTNTGKEKKKKKSEFNTRQQLTAERDGLINSVRKAELSKTEIQLLIDLLLNKQHEAPSIIDDWSEGKSDPVQKLKKQLAEKEKLLADEQQALAGAQAKLREIRTEQQTEKAQLLQKIRGLEELAQNRQIEIQAANNRFQVNAQKNQQLQAELNAEIVKAHKILEDNAALQMQAQQYEVSLAQMQDTDNLIVKLRNDVEELSAQNQQLQQIVAEKDMQQQHFMIQLTNLEGYKESHQELERNFDVAMRKEAEWKREISNLNSALQKQFEEQRNLEHALNQSSEQVRLTNNEKTLMKAELERTKEELRRLGEMADGKNSHEVEMLNLSNELSSTRNELLSKIEELQLKEKKYETELDASNKKCAIVEKELEEQKIKNNELRTKNWKVMEALNAAESKSNKSDSVDLKKLTSDVIAKERESQKRFVQRLFPDIGELESLDGDDWPDKYAQHVTKYIDALKVEQKQTTPVPSPPSSPQKGSEVATLHTQIQHYKNVINETEGILKQLQKHVEEEEMKWRTQLAAKEAELDGLRDGRLSQLQTKLSTVENELSREKEEKRKLSEECRLLKTQKPHNGTVVDQTATVEKLSEEVNRLREELRAEQTKNGDIGVCLKSQNCNNSTNGPAFIEAERHPE